jgi:DNA-binding MarR family transcriptional regulator
VVAAHKLWLGLIRESLRQYGISLNECQLILYLNCADAIPTAAAFASRSGMARSNVSKLVDGLRKKGFLGVETSEIDRRYQKIFLLPLSQSIVEMIEENLHKMTDSLMSGFSDEERQISRTLLAKVDMNLTKFSEEGAIVNE